MKCVSFVQFHTANTESNFQFTALEIKLSLATPGFLSFSEYPGAVKTHKQTCMAKFNSLLTGVEIFGIKYYKHPHSTAYDKVVASLQEADMIKDQ